MDATITIPLSALEQLIETIVERKLAARLSNLKPARRRKPHAKVSLARAAAITGLKIHQLRYIETHRQNHHNLGYPGRTGDNIGFVEAALRKWSLIRQSAIKTERLLKHGLANPEHRHLL